MELVLFNIVISPEQVGIRRAFTADFQINGKPAGMAKLEGPNETTLYRPLDTNGRKLIAAAEKYYQAQPGPIMNLSWAIERALLKQEMVVDIVQEHHFRKGMFETGIILYQPHGDIFENVLLRRPVIEILSEPSGEAALIRVMTKLVFPRMQRGSQILNNNLPNGLMMQAVHYQKFLIIDAFSRNQKSIDRARSNENRKKPRL